MKKKIKFKTFTATEITFGMNYCARDKIRQTSV